MKVKLKDIELMEDMSYLLHNLETVLLRGEMMVGLDISHTLILQEIVEYMEQIDRTFEKMHDEMAKFVAREYISEGFKKVNDFVDKYIIS